ncbi:TonB-dependent receptor [bacterium]|nr:MAG: TonB-dependent receptor [bacterium]
MSRISFICLILLPIAVFSQGTKKDTLHIPPFDTGKIYNSYIFDKNSDSTVINDFIWSDKKNISEIFNEKAGYFAKTFLTGGRNLLNYNGGNEHNIGVFRDGMQINDIIFGGFDQEIISVNEIKKIEEVSNIFSYLYGINTRTKAINIITKDELRRDLFSQLRYSQDRYGALFADLYFNMPLSKKLNFIFGMGNHSYDGNYTNSDFSAWRGRLSLNYYASPRFNVKTDFHYAFIQRGLNEGLINSPVDTLKDPIFARVYNSDAYEKIRNFSINVDLTAKIFKGKSWLSKLKLYVLNNLRLYRDEENRLNSNGLFVSNNFHTIVYGIDAKQDFNTLLFDKVQANLQLGGNYSDYLYRFNNFSPFWVDTSVQNAQYFYSNNYLTGFAKLDLLYKDFSVSSSVKTNYLYSTFCNEYGVEGSYHFIKTEDLDLSFRAGYNCTKNGLVYAYDAPALEHGWAGYYDPYYANYYEAGIKFRFKNLYIDAYNFDRKYYYEKMTFRDGAYSIKYISKYFDVMLNINNSHFYYYPDLFVKSDISYHNFFFNDNLNLRIGVNLKYIGTFNPMFYDQSSYINGIAFPIQSTNVFNADLYIGARIGNKANVNFTFANLLNRLNYDTQIYPWDMRGGLFNSLARFTIVWDFLK